MPARVGASVIALFTLTACAADPDVFQVALNDDSVLLGDPGEETVLSRGEITVGQSSLGKYLAARHAEAEGEFGIAANLLRDVLSEHGDNPDLLRRTHLLSVSEGQFAEAARLARRIVALGSDAPLAGLTLATVSARDGDLEAAARYLDAAPNDGTNQLLLPLLKAWLQAGGGDTDTALDTLAALGETPGFEVIADMHAGLIADFAGQAAVADAAFARALDGGQASLRLRLGYASFLSRHGRTDEAREVLEGFLEDRSDDLLVRAGTRRVGGGEYPGAAGQFGAGRHGGRAGRRGAGAEPRRRQHLLPDLPADGVGAAPGHAGIAGTTGRHSDEPRARPGGDRGVAVDRPGLAVLVVRPAKPGAAAGRQRRAGRSGGTADRHGVGTADTDGGGAGAGRPAAHQRPVRRRHRGL